MAVREKKKIETKRKILSAIGKLTEIHGIENLKVRDICKEADISIGTFYNYYDSIESILIDAIADHQDISVQRVNEMLTSEDEIENAKRLVKHFVGVYRNVPYSLKKEVFRIFIGHPEIKIMEVNRMNYDLINGIIQRGQDKQQISKIMDADSMTKLILKLIIGNCFVNCMRIENYDFSEQLVDEVMVILKANES